MPDSTPTRPMPPANAVLFVGDAHRAEFRTARERLESLACVRPAADVEAALAVLQTGFVPELIVVAQSFPDEFRIEAVDRLRRAAPLARLLGLMGSWCEGELRTGHPWPAVPRLYWHQFPAQCERELTRLHDGAGSTWGLPVTAGDEERLLAAQKTIEPTAHGLVVVWSRLFEMQDWIARACRLRGYSTIWLAPGRTTKVAGARAAIFDGCRCDEVEIGELAKLSGLIAAADEKPIPIVALLDFPRIEDHDRAMAAGAAAVLSKPLTVDDLLWQLDRVSDIA
ncbi:MAG: hypothetical protein U9N87_05995 [Planctomycetota bacterium]|nr:hypothetical protein [Planctomycetota bacterium]